MKIRSRKLEQFAASLLIVLSLFASSIAACACSHHQEKSVAENSSCHQHSAQSHSEEMPMPPEISAASFNANDDCVCIQPAPRVFAKSETVKIEKQAAAILPEVAISVNLAATIVTTETVEFVKPFYLSDSFYNIKSPRAPPVS